jgi:hypothetical protein
MDTSFKVAKGLSAEVLALMADWQEIRGHFYLSDYAENHYGRETLLDVLNREGHPFIPFAQDEETPLLLIQKTRIVGLRPSETESEDWPHMSDAGEDCWQQARMAFAGFTLEGKAYVGDMQPHQRRLKDLLNHGPSFFIFESTDGPWIVNRDLLNHLVPLS